MQPLSENAINIPAFLTKLWGMVNDPGTDHVISWSSTGKNFVIQNQAQFWYELLPVYYKHNNMSSFIRQLNMYGFHKMSTVENATGDMEKDEIQFYNPYFQRDQPELLKNIKRKVTATKAISSPSQYVLKSDDLSTILTDVNMLRGKQANVDNQLSAMKQENAVLWRELAMLRQKHIKQQQIVNKLIQFLVTMVQPTARMTGLGVKRPYPLMLNENPHSKKTKKSSTTSDGPTIHELDSTEMFPEELFADEADEINQTSEGNSLKCADVKTQSSLNTPPSPQSTTSRQKSLDLLDEVCKIAPITTEDMLLDSTELMDKDSNQMLVSELLDNELCPEALTENAAITTTDDLENLETPANVDLNEQRVFLNPTTQDTLLSNLINGSYNADVLNSNLKQSKKEQQSSDTSDLTVARIGAGDFSRINSVDDMDDHIENTLSEIDQLKDILNGYNSFDANVLLGLFNDDTPDYVLICNQNGEDGTNKNDPLVSGSELTTYGTGFGSINCSQQEAPSTDHSTDPDPDSTLNTPQIVIEMPQFPAVSKSK